VEREEKRVLLPLTMPPERGDGRVEEGGKKKRRGRGEGRYLSQQKKRRGKVKNSIAKEKKEKRGADGNTSPFGHRPKGGKKKRRREGDKKGKRGKGEESTSSI